MISLRGRYAYLLGPLERSYTVVVFAFVICIGQTEFLSLFEGAFAVDGVVRGKE